MSKSSLLIFMSTLFALNCASAYGGESMPAKLHLQWSLSLDVDGKITALTPLFSDDLRGTTKQVESVIRRWHFTPGSIGSQPAVTQTTLTIDADRTGSDSYDFRIVSATTGARYQHGPTPKYPKSSIRMGRYGEVSIQVNHDADGRVLSVAAMRPGDRHMDGALTRAALDAVKQWTFEPERVGGLGVAGSAIVPICFSLEGHQDPCFWTTPRGQTEVIDNNRTFPTTSVVSINNGAGHGP